MPNGKLSAEIGKISEVQKIILKTFGKTNNKNTEEVIQEIAEKTGVGRGALEDETLKLIKLNLLVGEEQWPPIVYCVSPLGSKETSVTCAKEEKTREIRVTCHHATLYLLLFCNIMLSLFALNYSYAVKH